ncbi:MAG: SixA phosphatase family protein [Hyphomicrobium sp.]
MLTLSLLRHAKSSWDDPELDDFERGLAPRGVKAAPAMGRHVAKLALKPDLILCSGAVRTRATVALMLPELGPPPPEVRYDDALYLASPITMLDTVRRQPAGPDHVMIVAHNPGMHALALELVGSGQAPDLGDLATRFPTAALAVLTFQAKKWSDVRPGIGRLVQFATPKGLRDEG